MPETRNIVILGASYAGTHSAHYLLKHVYPHLSNDQKITYKVVVVDPSEKILLRHATPRGVASSELMPDDAIFLDRQQGFAQYGSAHCFIHGSATSWDPESRTVTIRKEDGETETLDYHALVLATGTKSPAPFYTLQGGSHADVQSALHDIRHKVSQAQNIIIAGGGPTGVETAGELGELLNGTPGCFSSPSSAPPKVLITLYTTSDKLLPALRPAIAKQAETYLRRVGVTVRYGTRVASTDTLASGKTQVVFEDGTQAVTDVYIPAMGQTPMTAYAPRHLLDERGYVRANPRTTRVDAAGARVYAIGDAASYSKNVLPDINDAVPVLATNLKRDLIAAHADPRARPEGPDRSLTPNEKELQLVVIGRSKGVGAIFGWRVPSWFVWLIKGRDYMTSKGLDTVMGKEWVKESQWKAGDA